MLKRILFGLFGAIPSYFVGLFGCLWLLPILSVNRHDPSVEAAMTGAFIVGPLAAAAGFSAGARMVGSKHSSATPSAGDRS